MRLIEFAFLFFVIILINTSCIDEALFDRGEMVTDTIDLPDFSTIEAKNTFEIELVTDTSNKLLVTCGENLQPYIKIKVVDGILYLDHDIKNNWSRKYEKVKLKLYSKPFGRVNVWKPVKIFNTTPYKGPAFTFVDFMKYSELDLDLDVDYCRIAMSSDNFGNYKVKGWAREAELWGWGSCTVHAESLLVNNLYVLHRGMGNVHVNAIDNLSVSIQFTGNVYYYGNPTNISVDSGKGSGKLLKK